MISIAAVITLTEWSERTLWRRISDGTLTRVDDIAVNDKAKIPLDAVKSYFCVPIAAEDYPLIENADAGNAEAQTDLAIIFLFNAKPKSAIYWLKLAARQGCAEAMHWLGRCYADGNGLPKDENLGIMWIANAAAQGHAISQGQMQAMRDRFCGQH
ncbi:MAG: tetratricopeptide repeat protein [Burkholderiales bacterium]